MTTDQTAHLNRLKSHLRKGIELAEKATPQPWSIYLSRVVAGNEESKRYSAMVGDFKTGYCVFKNAREDDTDLIAHACNSHKAHCGAVLEVIELLEMEFRISDYAPERTAINSILASILTKYPTV